MSNTSTTQTPPSLLAGRWQVPLALVAAALGAATLYRLTPTPVPFDFDGLVARATALEQAGHLAAAVQILEGLLATQPPLSHAQQTLVHDRLATALFAAERGRAEHDPEVLRRIQAHDREARAAGAAPTSDVELRAALTHMWLGNDTLALEGFRALLHEPLPAEDRRAVLCAVVDLLEDRPDAKIERSRVLDSLLTSEAAAPGHLWWGLRRAVQDALDEHDPARARDLLATHGARLKNSALRGYLDFLSALVLLAEGRASEAEPLVQWVDSWLDEDPQRTTELDEFGHLPTLNRWLRGQLCLIQRQPEAALAAFASALELQPSPDIRVVVTIGQGRALASLDRHEEARHAFRETLARLASRPEWRNRALPQVRQCLIELHDQRQADHDFPNALEYLVLAADLVPERDADDSTSARAADPPAHDPLAWERVSRAVQVVKLDEPRLTALLWGAADAYEDCGRLADLRRALTLYVQGRSTDPRLPQAFLRLGQAYEGERQWHAALHWYARVMDEYADLAESLIAQVRRGEVLVAMGPESYAEAEALLTDVLSGRRVSPDAQAYRDALLAYGELLYEQRRTGEAISRLEDFGALYPQDPQRWRARFLVADAYRTSAYLLRDECPAGVSAEAASNESCARFQRAAELYEQLLDELEVLPERNEAQQLYEQLAWCYRGDCLFELNDADALMTALRSYNVAATRYADRPAGLSAYVQIANIYLRLGDLSGAAYALDHARALYARLPDDVYASSAGPSRTDWERFFTVVSFAELWRDSTDTTR